MEDCLPRADNGLYEPGGASGGVYWVDMVAEPICACGAACGVRSVGCKWTGFDIVLVTGSACRLGGLDAGILVHVK
jgi:hypothetical protein